MNSIHPDTPRIHPTWADMREVYLADLEVLEAYQALAKSIRGDDWGPPKPLVPQEDLGFPRFRVQISGLRRGEFRGRDELLFVDDRTEVADR